MRARKSSSAYMDDKGRSIGAWTSFLLFSCELLREGSGG